MFEKEPVEVIRSVVKTTLYIALLPLISSLLAGEISSFTGLLFGLIISLLLFRLKYIQIQKAVDMNSAGAASYIRNRYFITYGIYFIVLYTAHSSPKLNLLAVTFGLLFLKFTIVGMAIFSVLKDKWEKKMESYKEGRVIE